MAEKINIMQKKITPKLYGGGLLVLLIIFLLQPALILAAARDGIETWLQIVLPTLLPFFILNHLLSSYGVIEGVSRLCHRATRLLFQLPGEAAFVLAVGYTSGAPVSSTLVATFYRRGTITKKEAYRLLAASANASPLFIFSVVAASFLARPDLGATLALVHYGSNLLLALVWARFAGREASWNSGKPSGSSSPPPPFGEALAEAVSKSLVSVALVGGLIVSFFVLIAVLDFCRLGDAVATFLSLCNIDPALSKALFYGLWEMTAGSQKAAELQLGLRLQLAAASAVLAFGGLSVHMQIASQIRETDLKIGKYTIYKAVQAFVAFCWMFCMPIAEQVTVIPPLSRTVTISPLWAALPYLAALTIFAIHRLIKRRRLTR